MSQTTSALLDITKQEQLNIQKDQLEMNIFFWNLWKYLFLFRWFVKGEYGFKSVGLQKPEYKVFFHQKPKNLESQLK